MISIQKLKKKNMNDNKGMSDVLCLDREACWKKIIASTHDVVVYNNILTLNNIECKNIHYFFYSTLWMCISDIRTSLTNSQMTIISVPINCLNENYPRGLICI